MAINVPGELWLLYSVATQLGLRSIVDLAGLGPVRPGGIECRFVRSGHEIEELLAKLPKPEALRMPVV